MSGRVTAIKFGIGLYLGLFAILPGYAESLSMPNPPASSSVTMPGRGMTMDQVEAEFGVPLIKHDAVGEPPITQWEYNGFSVYFEHKWVIHSVGKRTTPPQPSQPAAPANETATPAPETPKKMDAPAEPATQQEDVTIPTLPLNQNDNDTTYRLPE